MNRFGKVLLVLIGMSLFALNTAHAEEEYSHVSMCEEIDYPGMPEGVILIDVGDARLYYGLGNDKAKNCVVGVGKNKMRWLADASHQYHIGRKEEWPSWTPPAEMHQRQPGLPVRMEGKVGDIKNPLGARALYIYDKQGKDTLFRIHGSNHPETMGDAVSSGCIRMMNNDVIDLYNRVRVGTRVIAKRFK